MEETTNYSEVPVSYDDQTEQVSWKQNTETIIKELLDTGKLIERIRCRLMNIKWDKEQKKYVSICVLNPITKKYEPLAPLVNHYGLNIILFGIESSCDKFVSLSNLTKPEKDRCCEEYAIRVSIDLGLCMDEFGIDPNNYDAIVDDLDNLHHAALTKALDAITLLNITANTHVRVEKHEGEQQQKAAYWGKM